MTYRSVDQCVRFQQCVIYHEIPRWDLIWRQVDFSIGPEYFVNVQVPGK